MAHTLKFTEATKDTTVWTDMVYAREFWFLLIFLWQDDNPLMGF